MDQELDKLFYLATQACKALERNYGIQIKASRPEQKDPIDGFPVLSFVLDAFNRLDNNWFTLGGFATSYNSEGIIDIADGFKTKDCGWDVLQEKMKGLNNDTKVVLLFAHWFYQYLKWFQNLDKQQTYKFF